MNQNHGEAVEIENIRGLRSGGRGILFKPPHLRNGQGVNTTSREIGDFKRWPDFLQPTLLTDLYLGKVRGAVDIWFEVVLKLWLETSSFCDEFDGDILELRVHISQSQRWVGGHPCSHNSRISPSSAPKRRLRRKRVSRSWRT